MKAGVAAQRPYHFTPLPRLESFWAADSPFMGRRADRMMSVQRAEAHAQQGGQENLMAARERQLLSSERPRRW